MNLTLRPTTSPDKKRALLEERLRQAALQLDTVPLSFAQQRLWLLDQLEPNSALYNVPIAIELRGELDLAALQKALEALIARHETLRTRFDCVDEIPVQIVEENLSLKIARHDLSGFKPAEREGEARRRLREEANRPFDLTTAPLLRATLYRLEADKHWLLLNTHHIISDEWSLQVCFRELTALYETFHTGKARALKPLPVQYADYALWQRDWLRGETQAKQLAYWNQQLAGNPPVLELPADHPRPAVPSFRGTTISRWLAPPIEAGLNALTSRTGTTPFMVFLAAFKTLLHRYTQQTDILVGAPIAGRHHPETEDLIGFFVNTLILRTDLAGDPTFETLLARVRETALGAFANQDLPLEKVVEELRPERTLNHIPFTRVMFAVQQRGLENLRWPGLETRLVEIESDTAKFDLTFVLQQAEHGWLVRIEFNRDLFAADSMNRLLGHFETLLTAIVTAPQRRLSELPLLTEAERRVILGDWNATKTTYPKDRTVAELFEAQVERTPNAVAVAYNQKTLTYHELNARANQLARHLKKFSVGPEVPVGLCMERSVDIIVAMVAILKAGGAYVPLDRNYPKPRLAHMLADAKAPVLVTHQSLVGYLPRSATRVVCIDSDWELIAREARTNLPSAAKPDNTAYLIYTSGSTGQPKGVVVPHRAIARLVLNTNYIELTPQDHIAQASNTSFDAATFEIWGALLNGARLVGISVDVALSPQDFARELREQQISVLFLTTALFNQMATDQPDAFASVRVLLFGGEAVDPQRVSAILKHRPKHLLHVYGPTENTTFSTWHEVREVAPDATTIPIGRPLANSQCYILDANLNPVPIGVPSELHVSGDGLARGYWKKPELSRQKFIPNPYRDGESAELLYKTGDLARWLPDGSIEFIGRMDQQVKLRGFRVELGEIESTLARHAGVRDCVVTVHANGNNDKKLAAYFVPSGKRAPGIPELRQFLQGKLPEYMVPASFVRLDSLPLTPNGKLDRQALPTPDHARPELEKRYATPQDAVEVELTRIWENVLGIHPIGIQDKFFELGGHSLLAVRAIAQIEKAFGRKLKLATIFQAPTIEQLAAILRKEIQEESAISGTSLVEIQPRGTRPPLFFVHGAGGGMFWGYINLARHLGQDQPVYGLRSRGLDGREEFATVEEMAAQYITDLRAVQPRGPYHIGGYCFGGNVAYEMARQLKEQGEEVAVLALFNCAPANSRYSRLAWWSPIWFMRLGINLCYWVKYFLQWTPPQRREFFRWKSKMLKRRADRFLGHTRSSKATVDAGELVDLSSFSSEQRKLWESHIRALVNYHPKPYAGNVQLFRSPGHPLLCSYDPDYGWGDLARHRVQIFIVPGVHEKILEEPCVKTLAQALTRCLNQSSTSSNPPITINSKPSESAPRPKQLDEWNRTAVDFSLQQSYSHAFELQAAKTPNVTALRFQNSELTYAQLNARANQLAHHLQALGVGPETLVAVCLDRSLDLPVTLLAIWKAGGAFVPLDRSYPVDRLCYMLADSQASLLVTQTTIAAGLNAGQAKVICLDDRNEQQNIQGRSAQNPACPCSLENLAYVIYTSGSTGQPKGVQITHRSLLNHNLAIIQAFQLEAQDRVLQFSPFSFDIAMEELFPSWLCGAAVVMRSDDTISSTETFLEFVRTENLSVVNIPTAYWHDLVDSLDSESLPSSLRLVVIGGERAADASWRRWRDVVGSKVTLINAYGPTESTITATLHIASAEEESLAIGRPIANTHVLILSPDLQLTPIGSEGELHIGGAGLARGYLNRPELTAANFIPNPFPEIRSERLYKTGDRARFRLDGTIEFLGRVDQQVKIRGFRIELGEIENALREYPTLKDAVVLAREDTPGQKRLVAYVVPRGGPAPGVSALLDFLKRKLPAHMMPSAFVPLEALPLSPSGKVDRQALPRPGDERPNLDQNYLAPRSPVEEIIASTWCEVLGLNRVGVHDNFFDLGGHSLLATQVLSRIRAAMQVDISLASLFDHPTVAGLAERLERAGNTLPPILPVARVSNGHHLPPTARQKRIWFLDQFEPQQSSYNIPTGLHLRGPLNVPALEQSLTELARRHDALRLVFPAEDGLPVQLICEPKDIHLQIIDLSHLPAEQRLQEARVIATHEGRRAYIRSSPMLRPILLRLGAEDHRLLLITHELACDSKSVRSLVKELTQLYQALSSGLPIPPATASLSYTDALSLVSQTTEQSPEQLEFWKQRLAGMPALLDLPADRPRPAHQNDAGARHSLLLSKAITTAIEKLSEGHGCTPGVTLLAAFQALLARYTGTTDIAVGSITSQRGRTELRDVVGNFENTAVLRSDLSGDPTFAELLGRVKEITESALAHADLPFARILEELRPPRNASYTPLFQVMFNYATDPVPATVAAGVSFEPFEIENQTAKLDLRLDLMPTSEGLSGWIEYSTALFDAERIERMAEHFGTLLQAAIENPEQRLSSLPLMPASEAHRVLVEWNQTQLALPTDAPLAQLFEEQVQRTPEAIALIAGNNRLTYAELNARANQLAHYLRGFGVGPGVLVGICLERSWRLLVGVLGVLKAGGAYVPLDPAYPKDRLAFILDDARAPLLLTEESLRSLQPTGQAQVICIDADWPEIRSFSRANPFNGVQPSELAYVIYTSGSTGQPKGVAIEHRSAVALVCWAKEVFTAEEISGVLASTSICFDLSIFEMFVPLSWGGTVILAENALVLPRLPAANEVTLINTVPSAIRELLRVKGVPASVRVVNLAGEPLATSIVNQIYAETQTRKVYDLYGPSETTTYSTFALREANAPATIGRPLANEQVYLLDSNRQPVPIGIPGELYIGGAKLARGYLHRPELTAERFVPNPFQAGTHLYRTGDLARWRTDGNLEFLGRLDHQVKIRGFRIELGEIESAFRKHSDLREALVIAREDAAGNKRLVAYLVPKTETTPSLDALRKFGRERLPEYMIPAAFVFLKALPLTPNGKVDRKALPEPDQERRQAETEFVAPRTPVEKQLAAIWREVLQLNRTGVRDNFFELGGDSLLAIQVISRVRESCKVELPLFSLFEAPTIEALANGLESGEWTQSQLPVVPLHRIPRDGDLPTSFVQERLWFLDQLEPGNHAYNVAVALRLNGALNRSALEQAFAEIFRRHEALRTRFVYELGALKQKIAAPGPVVLQTDRLELTPDENGEARIQEWLKVESQRPFNLATGPLARVHLAQVNPTEHVLLVVMHHTISDGWSTTILFQELEAFYNAFVTGKPAPRLPELSLQSADFAHWKRQSMQGIALEKELTFWREKLKSAPDYIALPMDHPEPEQSMPRAGRESLHLSNELARAITQASHRQNSTAFVMLTSALAITFKEWTHQADMVIGTVVAGRNHREMENVIGCFMNFLPIRTRISPNQTAREFLESVKTAVLQAQEHQDCPFEKIVEAVNPERRRNQNPLYNVALLLQNFPTELFRGEGLEVIPLCVDLEAALLDLRFEAEWTADGLLFRCEYKTDLFEPATIQQLLQSFKQILGDLIAKPTARLAEFKITAPLEAQARAARSRETKSTVAIASTFTAEPVQDALQYWAKELNLTVQVEFAPYNQIFQQLLDPASLTSVNTRGLNVLLIRPEDWFKTGATPTADEAERNRVAQDFVAALKSAVDRSATPYLVLFCPASKHVAADPIQAQAMGAVESFIASQLEGLNSVQLLTTSELLKFYPVSDYYDASGDELGRVPYTPVGFAALGTMIMRKWHVLQRQSAKVIVLDCDQTLWSGVCGEDGAKGISLDAPRHALQEFMRAQHQAGRLLAICSKNNEEDVREVFAHRLDMPLRSEHFIGWRTNWLPKSQNLQSLAQELNLGLDSFIFVDDNPVECAEVEANCPEVLTLQLPEDPAQIPHFLQHCWAFDHAQLTAEDRKRGEMYRENQQRDQLRTSVTSLADFISSLQLHIAIEPMSPAQAPRVSQLTQRTNQFNCTSLRRSESDIQKLARNSDILTVTVRDRFGDYGLVGVVICSTEGAMLQVETFLLSCRVLGRGVEHAVLARLGKLALDRKLDWVDVHFNRSDKNKPAFDFLDQSGGSCSQGLNGGYIYRFSAQLAAKMSFNPTAKEESPKPESGRRSRRNLDGLTEKPAPGLIAGSRQNLRPQLNPANAFSRFRTIAIEADHPEKIYQAIERRASRRAAGQAGDKPPRTETERQLCAMFEQLLHVEGVGRNASFFDLGGHSLLAVRLFAELEKLTGRKLPLVTIFQSPTIEELARVLEEEQQSSSRSPLVAVQANGSRPPLFLAHGVGGDVLWGYANLAKHLSADQPIYGIKSRGQIGLDEYDSIEEMARYYVSEVRAFQPHGPYYLGGYCLGGNVAYEMARQLRAQGESVAMVALIDAFPSNAGYERVRWWQPQFPFRFTRNAWYWLQDFQKQTAEERRRFVIRKARILRRKLLGKFKKKDAAANSVDLEEVIDPAYFPEHELKFWEIHLRALTNHVEKPYDGPVTLIRTRGQPLLCSLADDFCWGDLVRGGVQIKHIPGSHEDIFVEPNVKHLAEQMAALLSATQPKNPQTTSELITA